MKKYLLIPSLVILLNTSAYPTENVSCPMNITCSYETGQCNTPTGWVLDAGAAQEPFSGQQVMNLSKIWANKQGSPPNQVYQFECTYNYGNQSAISIYTYVQNLIGDNWIFSGFGKQMANCSNTLDPMTCYGEK